MTTSKSRAERLMGSSLGRAIVTDAGVQLAPTLDERALLVGWLTHG